MGSGGAAARKSVMLLHSSDAVEDLGVEVEGPPSPRHLHMPKSGGIRVRRHFDRLNVAMKNWKNV